MRILPPSLIALFALACAAPAAAQDMDRLADAGTEETVYDGDWLSVGLGLGVGPTYDGSDDYFLFPVPLVQGKLGGIGINPRPAGIALDFVPDPQSGPGFAFGPSVRLRANRAMAAKDPVVATLGKLDRAVELGPSAGISFPALLNPYDSLTMSVDVRWDLAGAHDGMVVNPSISYFTPLSRGAAVLLTLDAEHGDHNFMDYYYSVSPADAATSGLSQFQAGSGWSKAGVLLLGGVDLNGDLADGGFALFAVGSYSHMLGDGAQSPFTSERGRKGQFLGAIGMGYTF